MSGPCRSFVFFQDILCSALISLLLRVTSHRFSMFIDEWPLPILCFSAYNVPYCWAPYWISNIFETFYLKIDKFMGKRHIHSMSKSRYLQYEAKLSAMFLLPNISTFYLKVYVYSSQLTLFPSLAKIYASYGTESLLCNIHILSCRLTAGSSIQKWTSFRLSHKDFSAMYYTILD